GSTDGRHNSKQKYSSVSSVISQVWELSNKIKSVWFLMFSVSCFPVSQMVIEEVSAIQENLEIERTCRESAEALASKLNCQNRSLKRKSMMLLSHLSPDTITDINLDDEEEEDGEDLDLLKEKHDNTVLIAETVWQKKLLGKYNRVSQFAVEEYKALQDTLDLEKHLRTEAETFGREMVVEQKKLKRQSQILMQSSSPSQALLDALSQVTRLTQDLETQRLEHQNQVSLHNSELQKKLQAAINPPPTPAPPPPPPPPPPAPALASNPLSFPLRQTGKPLNTTRLCVLLAVCVLCSEMDVRQQAVDEMMQRIKKGIQLRPLNQSPNRARRQENFNRTPPQPKAASPSTNHDEELQRILLRRRGALESVSQIQTLTVAYI
uniref:Shootin-1 n=1 Tax=Seriola dumerili TaxID=41447 RepID=A0A3B4VIE4_SERDU